MRGLIVAAGQGVRLRGVAHSKPLATVGGVPLIEHVIASATLGGISAFVVVVGYEATRLQQALQSISERLRVPIACVFNPDWRGANGLSVLAAASRLNGPFALLMSDHLFEPSILSDLLAHDRDPARVTLAVDRRLDNPMVDLEDVTRVRTGPDGAILGIGKLIAPYDAFDTGLFRAGPALLEALREDVAAGGTAGISAGMQRLAARGQARTFDIGDRFWIDVDDAAALRKAELQAAASAR